MADIERNAIPLTSFRFRCRGRMVSIERYAIPLCKANPRLPENLFLCPSGGDAVKSIRFSETQRRDICEVLNK